MSDVHDEVCPILVTEVVKIAGTLTETSRPRALRGVPRRMGIIDEEEREFGVCRRVRL